MNVYSSSFKRLEFPQPFVTKLHSDCFIMPTFEQLAAQTHLVENLNFLEQEQQIYSLQTHKPRVIKRNQYCYFNSTIQ